MIVFPSPYGRPVIIGTNDPIELDFLELASEVDFENIESFKALYSYLETHGALLLLSNNYSIRQSAQKALEYKAKHESTL